MTEETPQKAYARRLLSIAALEKLLAAEKGKLKAAAAAAFDTPGDRAAVTLDDGTPLGNVRADAGSKAGWQVTDAGALRAWVEENVPGGIVEQVTTTVDPELVAALLDSIVSEEGDDGDWLVTNPKTGEIVLVPPGIAYVQAGPPKLVVSAHKDAPEALRRQLGDAAARQLGIGS